MQMHAMKLRAGIADKVAVTLWSAAIAATTSPPHGRPWGAERAPMMGRVERLGKGLFGTFYAA